MNLSKLNPLTIAEKVTGRPMAESTRHFFRDSIFYSAANFVPRVLGLFLWPVIALLIEPGGYAIFSNYISAITVICVILSCQVELSVARYYYENRDDFPKFVGTQFFFTLGLSAVMFIQFWIFKNTWAGWFMAPVFVFLLALATSLAQIAHQVYFQLLLARKESLKYLNYSLAKQLIYFIVALVLLVLFYRLRLVPAPGRYLALVYAHLASTVVLAVAFVYFIIRLMRPAFNWGHLSYALRLTLPGVPGALSACALNYFDRVYISHKSLDLAGQYAFAYQLGMLIMMLTSGIFSAYMPRFYENRNQERFAPIQRLFARNLKLLLLAAAGLILASRLIAGILGRPQYFGALPIIPIVVSGYIFYYLSQCYGLYIGFRRQYIGLQSAGMVLAGLANVLLNVWLLPLTHYNVKIAALSTLAAYLLQWIFMMLIARILLKEKTVNFKGLRLPFLAYLAFSAAWCFIGY